MERNSWSDVIITSLLVLTPGPMEMIHHMEPEVGDRVERKEPYWRAEYKQESICPEYRTLSAEHMLKTKYSNVLLQSWSNITYFFTHPLQNYLAHNCGLNMMMSSGIPVIKDKVIPEDSGTILKLYSMKWKFCFVQWCIENIVEILLNKTSAKDLLVLAYIYKKGMLPLCPMNA